MTYKTDCTKYSWRCKKLAGYKTLYEIVCPIEGVEYSVATLLDLRTTKHIIKLHNQEIAENASTEDATHGE